MTKDKNEMKDQFNSLMKKHQTLDLENQKLKEEIKMLREAKENLQGEQETAKKQIRSEHQSLLEKDKLIAEKSS